MTASDRTRRIHELDATVRVGKAGVEGAASEIDTQLDDRDLVKVSFLRSARGGTDVETLAANVAERVDADVVETRGNTAVFER